MKCEAGRYRYALQVLFGEPMQFVQPGAQSPPLVQGEPQGFLQVPEMHVAGGQHALVVQLLPGLAHDAAAYAMLGVRVITVGITSAAPARPTFRSMSRRVTSFSIGLSVSAASSRSAI